MQWLMAPLPVLKNTQRKPNKFPMFMIERETTVRGLPILYLSVVWTVIGLAAIVRSYILLMGANTPEARRKTATTTRVAGFTLIVVGAIQMLVWVFTA